MSERKAGFPTRGLAAEEAEEFMALLLSAQGGDHDCPFARYFRKIGQRLIKQYTPKEGKPE